MVWSIMAGCVGAASALIIHDYNPIISDIGVAGSVLVGISGSVLFWIIR